VPSSEEETKKTAANGKKRRREEELDSDAVDESDAEPQVAQNRARKKRVVSRKVIVELPPSQEKSIPKSKAASKVSRLCLPMSMWT
jgi:hypothetical protein